MNDGVQAQPSRLITGANPAPSDVPVGVPGLDAWAVLVIVLGSMVAMALVSRRRRSDPRERAFARMAHEMRLDARTRAAVRRLARFGGGAHPVVLLIAPSALARSIHLAQRRGVLRQRDLRAGATLLGLLGD